MKTSIDFILLSFDTNELQTLIIKRDEEPFINQWALPGYLVTENQDIKAFVHEQLSKIFNQQIPYYKQVETFGDLERHPDGHVLTICYYVLMDKSTIRPNILNDHNWVNVNELPTLAFDHESLVETCVKNLKQHVKISPVAFHLIPKNFKISEIHAVYQEIYQFKIDRRNFSRKLKSLNIIVNTGLIESAVKHRPAELYTFKEELYEQFQQTNKLFKLP